MFIIECKKNPSMSYLKIKSKYFVIFASRHMVTNEHQYVTKMTLNASVRGLRGDFIAMFLMVEYIQRPIYIWNKISKCIMFQCGMDFQSILYI